MRSPTRPSVAALAALAVAVLALAAGCASEPALTQVILVRHAEKADASADPELSPAGRARAEALASAVREAHVRAVFATQWRRTQETVAPTVAATGAPLVIVDARDPQDLARRIRTEHAGEVVLVAGHSNTVPQIVEALGGGPVGPIGDDAYDNLFVVTLRGSGPASVLHLKYVAPAAP